MNNRCPVHGDYAAASAMAPCPRKHGLSVNQEPSVNQVKAISGLEKRTHGGRREGSGRPRKWVSDAERKRRSREAEHG